MAVCIRGTAGTAAHPANGEIASWWAGGLVIVGWWAGELVSWWAGGLVSWWAGMVGQLVG